MIKNIKLINIDVSELPFNKKRKVVDELTDIYKKVEHIDNINHKYIKFIVPIGNVSHKDTKKDNFFKRLFKWKIK